MRGEVWKIKEGTGSGRVQERRRRRERRELIRVKETSLQDGRLEVCYNDLEIKIIVRTSDRCFNKAYCCRILQR